MIGKLEFEMRDTYPRARARAEDRLRRRQGPGKPVGIQKFIGRRPIFAFGNSDGDLQMLRMDRPPATVRASWALVHHTDADREWAYDRDSPIGKLDKALDEATRARVDGRRHEARLEARLPVRKPLIEATRLTMHRSRKTLRAVLSWIYPEAK